MERFVQRNNLKPVSYNIELKSREDEYGKYQPEPAAFVDLVMEVIKEKNISGRYNIQSFDPEILEVMHARYPEVPLAYLVYQPGIAENLEKLSFIPEIYSPNYQLVNESFTDSVRAQDMKIIPWTVNDSLAIKKMISLKVDGIITDYPARVHSLLGQTQSPME